jgi:RNase adapter protein RapZ
MLISIFSFGFKHGTPVEADLLVDVRFLRNPYVVPELNPLDGREEPVRRYIEMQPEAQLFYDRYFSLVELLVSLYEREGKSSLTLAVGCTGGRHRSVAVAEKLASHLTELGRDVAMNHRDIDLA